MTHHNIQLLPDSVANQIAAGEVIQQPSSVVKELVENAVDAGARHITVVVRDGGRTLIQVIDDGCGMAETDARLAFERHATSKISKADDLFALTTMGFRGEALASIAAVAQVELRTRRHDEEVGTRIEISASKVTAQEPCACPAGSSMAVKNLFFQLPGRRRFLRKDAVEFAGIVREFERLAIVNPGVELTLINNDATHTRLAPATLKQRLLDLFGKGLGGQLVPVDTDTAVVAIHGFIGKPENARRRGALQYLTVNGRNMRHPVFHKAVMQCFEPLLPRDAKPNFFLDFQVEPSTIDVNIHPTKNEIKFENEAAIRQILIAAIRESMGRYNVAPAIDFESTDAPELPPFNPDAAAQHEVEYDPRFNPFGGVSGETTPRGGDFSGGNGGASGVSGGFSGFSGGFSGFSGGMRASRLNGGAGDWERLYSEFAAGGEGAGGAVASALNAEGADTEGIFPEPEPQGGSGAIQLKGRYLLTPCHEGVMVVDQHRAHVNVLYHSYMRELEMARMASQTLLFPETVELAPSQSVLVDSVIDDLRTAGFDLAFLGDNTWSVNAVPAVVSDGNAADTLRCLVDELADAPEGDGGAAESLRSAMALGMAEAAAVRPGQPLTAPEIEHLLSGLFRLASPAYTPKGQRVLATITLDQLASLL